MRNALIDSVRSLTENRAHHRPIFIVIDGPAGVGKTTLANEIRNCLGLGEIIHCDDLYNGWDDALSPTLERHFNQWIVDPLRQGLMPRYLKYDWSAGAYSEEVQVPESSLVILEGVGAAVKNVAEIADISIWMELPESLGPTFGLTRVLERDGMQIEKEMRRWITEQQDFFEKHHNRDNCSVHLPYGAPSE